MPGVPGSEVTSRRSLLAGLLGGLAGAIATTLGRPGTAQAAAGDHLVIGQQNYGGSSATRLATTSSGGAFWMTQNGSGSGIRADSLAGHGGVFTTGHPDRFAINATSTAPETGGGAGVRADGGLNHGVEASTSGINAAAVQATHLNNGIAVRGDSAAGYGTAGFSTTGYGVRGESESGYGVVGAADAGDGVSGFSNSGYGVYGTSNVSYAGYFDNEVFFDTYLDIDEMTTPGVPSVNNARLFARDNGSGKTQLCVMFSSGNIVVLGTQA